MSKHYTEKPNVRFSQVKSENLNDNITKTLGEVNGNLNSNNLPVDALTFDKFTDPDRTSLTSNATTKLDYEGATQDYHSVRRWNTFEDSNDMWEPVESINLQTANWSTGWNKLVDYGSMDYTFLDFDAKEGILTGNAVIDFHHGIDRIVYQSDDTTFRVFYGYDWYTEWGVFVNDTLVAETSYIYARRITCNIPFKVPVGSQKVKIDLRWRAVTSNAVGTPYQGNPTRPLDIFGAHIWVRNVKR